MILLNENLILPNGNFFKTKTSLPNILLLKTKHKNKVSAGDFSLEKETNIMFAFLRRQRLKPCRHIKEPIRFLSSRCMVVWSAQSFSVGGRQTAIGISDNFPIRALTRFRSDYFAHRAIWENFKYRLSFSKWRQRK